jgi:hypothetical protein
MNIALPASKSGQTILKQARFQAHSVVLEMPDYRINQQAKSDNIEICH